MKGETIEEVRQMTDAERESFGWPETMHQNPTVLVLSSGERLLPAQDPELNGPGELIGLSEDNEIFGFVYE